MSGVFDYWLCGAVSFCFHALFVFISTYHLSKLQDRSPALGNEGRNRVTQLYLDLAVLRQSLAGRIWVCPNPCHTWYTSRKSRENEETSYSVTMYSSPWWPVRLGAAPCLEGGRYSQAAPGQGLLLFFILVLLYFSFALCLRFIT